MVALVLVITLLTGYGIALFVHFNRNDRSLNSKNGSKKKTYFIVNLIRSSLRSRSKTKKNCIKIDIFTILMMFAIVI